MTPEEAKIIRGALIEKLLYLKTHESNPELQEQIRILLTKIRIQQ
jgi:hypothetical protein